MARDYAIDDQAIGFLAVDLDTGEILAAHRENDRFIPASTAKVATAVAALEVLGPNYRFGTGVFAVGELSKGVLEGTLYLRGGGDPLLSVQDLHGLAGRLADAGLRRVSGRFVYDSSFLTAAREINPRQPADAGYNPGIGALSLDFNRLPAPAGYRPLPGAQRSPGDGAVPVKQPGLRTAQVFRRIAAGLGVSLPAPESGSLPRDARPLAAVAGQPLLEVLRPALEYSNNLVSELIGAVASRRLAGRAEPLTTHGPRLGGWLQQRITGTDWTGHVRINHSGLAASARMTPAQMVAVLRYADGRRYGGWRLQSLLPAAGYRDSIGRRFRDAGSKLRVWAKTGTLHYAKGLAGYLITETNRRAAFAVYVTDFPRRRAYDSDPARQSPAVQARAKAWTQRAGALIEGLVKSWTRIP